MNYLFKLLAEEIVNTCKIFDNNIANAVVVAIALFVSFNPAWDITKIFYKVGIIKKSNSGSATHWSIRAIIAIAFIFLVKVVFSMILFIKRNWIKIFMFVLVGISIYFLIRLCEKHYKKRKI